jgi:hypothetical protein
MNEDGECEEKSIHSANIVEDEEGKFVLQRWYRIRFNNRLVI